ARGRGHRRSLRSASGPCDRQRPRWRSGPKHSLPAPPTHFLQPLHQPVVVARLGCDRHRLVEDGVAAARTRNLSRRWRRFVALPAGELVVDEIDGELALLEHAPVALEAVDVVPAAGMERIGKQRRAQREADLLRGQSDLELVYLILGNEVALIDIELVNADVREP